MTSPHERSGTLEAIDRILNRGGDADVVLRDVVDALFRLYSYVAISFVEGDGLVLGPSVGVRESESGGRGFPVSFQGKQVAELNVEFPEAEDDEFLSRVATLISAHCLVGWDTGGKPWEP